MDNPFLEFSSSFVESRFFKVFIELQGRGD